MPSKCFLNLWSELKVELDKKNISAFLLACKQRKKMIKKCISACDTQTACKQKKRVNNMNESTPLSLLYSLMVDEAAESGRSKTFFIASFSSSERGHKKLCFFVCSFMVVVMSICHFCSPSGRAASAY